MDWGRKVRSDLPISLMEPLESRRLLATIAPGLPFLMTTLTYKGPPVAVPGAKGKLVLEVTNISADLPKTSVPIAIYVSPTPSIASSATPELTEEISISVKTHYHETISFHEKATANESAPGWQPAFLGANYFIVALDSDGSIPGTEISNQTMSAGPVYNPLGNYAGTTTLAGDQSSLTINLTNEDRLVMSAVELGAYPSNFNAVDAVSSVSQKGKYSLSDKGIGVLADVGLTPWSMKIVGQISGDTITGTILLKGVATGSKTQISSSFSVTRATS